MLSKDGISHCVCVATDYGREVMEKTCFEDVRVGRMDREDMVRFFKENDSPGETLVIDATHPYAREATENIRSAAAACRAEYIRVLRKKEGGIPENARTYENVESCAAALKEEEGNILLTTGSRDLAVFFKKGLKSRSDGVYVRVLPDENSLKICRDLGIGRDHVIAMQGPFSEELNGAIIRQYGIKHLVTKDSGKDGGFLQKLHACKNTGACLHVIKRPEEEEGVSGSEAYGIITGKLPVTAKEDLLISLIGFGMGSPGNLTRDAKEAIESADAVFGSKRLLKALDRDGKYEMFRAEDLIPFLEDHREIKKAAVVFSGDTGFFSGAHLMQRELKKWKTGIDIRIFPGISSFSFLCARLGETYEDACLFSLHGRNADSDINRLADLVRHNAKVFTLLSGPEDVSAIAKRLSELKTDVRMIVGRELASENERIDDLTLEEAEKYEAGGIAVALIYNNRPEKRPVLNIIRDKDMIRGEVPMTKECIRHESLIRLGLKEGDLLYDIGGGTGSVGLEAAALSHSLRVFTLERDKKAAELIRENIKKTGLDNISLVEGEAAETLKDMEKPDCVFIGGSGGRLKEILSLLHSKGKGIRFVINAVTLETIEEIKGLTGELGAENEEAVMISVSDVKKAGSHHLLKAQNPVWIFSFTL